MIQIDNKNLIQHLHKGTQPTIARHRNQCIGTKNGKLSRTGHAPAGLSNKRFLRSGVDGQIWGCKVEQGEHVVDGQTHRIQAQRAISLEAKAQKAAR
jgi:hypothetical protein